jgi:choline dehydrogenase-like flavoprotein
MGQVMDYHCRAKGIDGLRVVDGTVIPIPLAVHIQAAVYAIAEKAANMIASDL